MKVKVHTAEAYAVTRGSDVIQDYADRTYSRATVKILNSSHFTIDGYAYELKFQNASLSSRPHVTGYFHIYSEVTRVKLIRRAHV